MSREPAKRRSRTHAVSPCRTTKSLSLLTTPPFYPDSLRGRVGRAGMRWPTCFRVVRRLELDELGEDDVGHGADLVECGRVHRIVEVQDRHGAPAAALAAKLHPRDVDPAAAAEGADAADHARHVQVCEDEHPALRQRLE